MRNRKLGLQLGLEDDGETPMMDATEVDETGAPIKGDETVEAEELAVDEASDDVAEEIEVGEDLQQAEETLEGIYGILRDAKEAGRGISQESAQFMQIAIESIKINGKRLNMEMLDIPSCESFGRSSRAADNTEISMERVGEVLKNIWEWIKTQVKKLVAKIKNWFQKVLGAAPRLKKRAEAIKKKADGTSGSSDESTVELSVHRQLHINKKNVDPSDAKTALTELSSIVKVALGKTDAMVKSVDASVDALATDDPDEIKGVLDTVVKTPGLSLPLKNTISGGKLLNADRYDNDANGKSSNELFGGKAYVSFIRGSGSAVNASELKKKLQSAKSGFDNVSKKAVDIDSNADYKVLTTSDVSDLCDGVIDICDYITDYEKQWEDRQKAGDKITKACDKLKSRVDKDKGKTGDGAREIKDAAQAVHSYWSKSIARDTGIIGYSLTAGRCLLTWCERSLATYKN